MSARTNNFKEFRNWRRLIYVCFNKYIWSIITLIAGSLWYVAHYHLAPETPTDLMAFLCIFNSILLWKTLKKQIRAIVLWLLDSKCVFNGAGMVHGVCVAISRQFPATPTIPVHTNLPPWIECHTFIANLYIWYACRFYHRNNTTHWRETVYNCWPGPLVCVSHEHEPNYIMKLYCTVISMLIDCMQFSRNMFVDWIIFMNSNFIHWY